MSLMILQTKRTPNVSERRGKVKMIVLHSTEGALNGALEWLCSPKSKASAHYVIGRNGEIYKLAPLSVATWHTKGKNAKGESYNDISIGIELERYGDLKYTEAQLNALAELLAVLLESYEIETITTHRQLDPKKSDPLNFPFRLLWTKLLRLQR